MGDDLLVLFELSNPGKTVVDSAEDVANDRTKQHENPP
jgi:hypothetical protein